MNVRTKRRALLAGGVISLATALGAYSLVSLAAGASAATAATDLACGKTASASSNSSSAAKTVDCVAGTVWQSTTTKPQQLQVDLGSTVAVDHVTIAWGAGYGTSFKIRTAPDGASWHTATTVNSGSGGTQTVNLPSGTQTRWIQLYLSQYAGSAGFTVDELSVYGTPGTTPTTPPTTKPTTPTTPPTTPTTPPTSGGGKTWNVTDAAGFKAALAGVAPGDTIHLADGAYNDQFVATKPGTASKPITVTGSKNAIITDPLFAASDTDCPSGLTGYGLWLNGAPYWNLEGFTAAGGKKGIVMDASPHVTVDGVTVHNIGYEGVHFRKGSDHGILENSDIYHTGLEEPGYGEGVYIGSANSNWTCYAGSSGVDASDYVQVLNNHIGPDVAAENIDIKEGTHDGVIFGNVMDSTGEQNQHDADSNMDVKGDHYTISNNTLSHPVTDTIQVHNVYANYGCANIFQGNKMTVTATASYGINVTDKSQCASNPNIVYASNTESGGKGLTNSTVTAGG
jgi:F5/8 type C domain-containing protein